MRKLQKSKIHQKSKISECAQKSRAFLTFDNVHKRKAFKTCKICEKGNLIQVEDITLEIEGYIFIVKGERCSNCNEEFPYEEETQKTISIARKIGIWPEPLKLYRHLSKSGGGLIFRIPSDLEKQLKLNENIEIAITKMGNKIVIEPEKDK